MAKHVKCVICDRRPARVNGRCTHCNTQIEAVSTAKAKAQPRHFLTYRGHVVGLYRNGGQMLVARLLRRSDKYLPKRKTVNLNIYCNGFTRETIKQFKACVLGLAQG